ncbi:hypothetical protein IKN40_02755 [bacterium]|nr:hypothetical protein [bacterium]
MVVCVDSASSTSILLSSAELCSCSIILFPFLVDVIILPPHAAGEGVVGFTFSVYATNVDAEQV